MARPSRSGPRGRAPSVGPDRAAHPQPAGRASVARARRIRVSAPACSPVSMAATSASTGQRCGETIGDPAERALARAGVDVRLGWRAERRDAARDGFRGARSDDLPSRGRDDRRAPARPRGRAARADACRAARLGWARSEARRSSTCTSSMTARSASSRSPPASIRRCSTCSIARRRRRRRRLPVPGGVAVRRRARDADERR